MAVIHPPDLTLTADVGSMFDQDAADNKAMVGRIRYPGTVSSVEFIPAWTNAGADTNYRTLNLYNRGTAGAGTTLVATLALTSGVDLTKFVAKAITITAANATVAVGDVLEWVTSATGTGAPDVGGKVIVQQAVTY
jgi:hypothetical protein